MIRGRGKNKKGLWKNLVVALVLVSVVVPQFFAFPKKASAEDTHLLQVFPHAATQSQLGNASELPAGISTTGAVAYTGAPVDSDHADNYLVSQDNLKLENNNAKTPTANKVDFYVNINFAGAAHNATANPTNDQELGSWNVLYDTDETSNADSNGVFLTIGEGVANQGRLYPGTDLGGQAVTTPPLVPFVCGNPTNEACIGPTEAATNQTASPYSEPPIVAIPLDKTIDFSRTQQRIPVELGNIGLAPNRQYYAQLELIGEGTRWQARSNIITFKTGDEAATGTVDTSADAASITDGESIVGQTNNQADILVLAACEATSPSTWVQGCIVQLVYYILYIPSRWILEAAGWFLDITMVFSISSKIYSDPTFITEGWRIVRDVSNIFFIFLLVSIAFQIILDMGSAQAKKMLGTLVVIALVVNFSLFLTKVVIDSSNVLARIFYGQITITGSTRPPLTSPDDVNNLQEKSLSQALADGFNVQKMLSDDTVQKLQNERGDSPSFVFLIVVLGLTMNIIAAWSFFITGLLMVGRIVGLWVVMIFAAFAFVSRLAPNILGRIPRISWKDWSSDLFSLSFLAPIFLFFVYIIITFVNEHFLDGLFKNIKDFDFTSLMVAIALQFAILIALIKQSRKLAEKLAGEAGGAILSGMKGVTSAVSGVVTGAAGLALGAATGGAAALARGTIGRTASKASQSESLRDRMASGGINGWIAKQQLKAANAVAGSSFDARNTKAFTSATRGLGGKGQVGGFTGTVERKKKAEIENARLIQTKKSDQQLKNLPENKEKAKKYEEDVETYRKQRNTDYEAWVAPRKNQPGFNPADAMKEFMKDYATDPTKNPNLTNKRPEPPVYATADSINAQRQAARTKYLQRGTVRAWSERNLGAVGQTLAGGAIRQGELAAAAQLAGNPKDNAKLDTRIADLTKAGKQLEEELNALSAALKRKTKEFVDQQTGKPLTGQALADEVERRKVPHELESANIKRELTALTRTYQTATTQQAKDAAMLAITQKKLQKKKHDDELLFLKNIFKLEADERKKKEQFENNKTKLKEAKAKRPGPGEAPKP